MNFQKLKGGLIAGFAMTGLVASLGLGSGLAAVADIDSTDTTPEPSSTVQTAENCVWTMTGAPSALNLEPLVDGAVYDGSEMTISTGTSLGEIEIYSSGNEGSQESPTNCTFYGGTEAPKLTWSVAQQNSKFEATYEGGTDSDFDFDFALTFDLEDKNSGQNRLSCDAAFKIQDVTLDTSTTSVIGIQIPDITDVASPIENNNGDSCTTTVKAETTIPQKSAAPASPGAEYTWTGPTVTITGSTYQ